MNATSPARTSQAAFQSGKSVLREFLRRTGLVIRPTSADTSRSSRDASGTVACPGVETGTAPGNWGIAQITGWPPAH
jgi:hypothetical protein